ncbi:hypothetical protein JOE40_002247 [Arthrobacter sp. PvP102]|nr:hypothetical protein [Arthrobacter sp. PvP103]MBP1237738.1 hypothetical protein [Arthrobacter sp. PvP102]
MIIDLDVVASQRFGTGGGAPGVQPEGVLMQRAQDHVLVDGAVRDRAALVWADSGQGPQAAVPEPEHRHLFAVDAERPPLPEGDLAYGAQVVAGIHRTGTWGSTVSGSEVRN